VQNAPFNETNWTDLNGGVTAYVKSKTLAERAAWDFIAQEGGNLELSVVLGTARASQGQSPKSRLTAAARVLTGTTLRC